MPIIKRKLVLTAKNLIPITKKTNLKGYIMYNFNHMTFGKR